MKLRNMFKTGAVSALAFTAVTATAQADMAPVADIDVSVQSLGIADASGNAFLNTLSGDLEQAIADRVMIEDNEKAVDIEVEVRNLSLNGTPIGPDATDFNNMEGVVEFLAAGTNTTVLSFPVNLAAYQAEGGIEGYTMVKATDGDFYAAMVAAFATQTAEWLENVNTNQVKMIKNRDQQGATN